MTWDGISQPAGAVWAPLRMGQVYGAKLMEFSAENVNSTLEFFGELSAAKTPRISRGWSAMKRAGEWIR